MKPVELLAENLAAIYAATGNQTDVDRALVIAAYCQTLRSAPGGVPLLPDPDDAADPTRHRLTEIGRGDLAKALDTAVQGMAGSAVMAMTVKGRAARSAAMEGLQKEAQAIEMPGPRMVDAVAKAPKRGRRGKPRN